MRTNNEQSSKERGIRPLVWLSVLGVTVIVVAISFSRKSTSNLLTKPSLVVSNLSQRFFFSKIQRAAGPATSEPTYQGRRLSEWIEDLKAGDNKTKEAARDALSAMGVPAIPALTEALNDPRSLNPAAFALGNIGQEALPVLLQSLTNGPLAIRREIAGAGVIQVNALLPHEDKIVPALVECMRQEDAGVRGGAVNALQSYWKRPDVVMPSLMNCLTDPDANVRGSAVTVIQKFARNADAAIPVLVRLARQDPDSYVKTRAAESLHIIAPHRAEQEGL